MHAFLWDSKNMHKYKNCKKYWTIVRMNKILQLGKTIIYIEQFFDKNLSFTPLWRKHNYLVKIKTAINLKQYVDIHNYSKTFASFHYHHLSTEGIMVHLLHFHRGL